MSVQDDLLIRYTLEDGTAATFALHERAVVVGSGIDADLRVPDRYLSRKHFRLELFGGQAYVTDLGSRNGTALNGRRLNPNVRSPWNTGDLLVAAGTRFEISLPQTTRVSQLPADRHLTLTAEENQASVKQPAVLNLRYDGGTAKQIYLESHVQDDGIIAGVNPTGSTLLPGQQIPVVATFRQEKRYWSGGRIPVRITAYTQDGLIANADIMVTVRPRYALYMILLLLLLLCGLGSLFTATRLIPIVPTAVAQSTTEVPTETNTAAPSRTPLPTVTQTLTERPTFTATGTDTPFPTATASTVPCVVVCPAGWTLYTVQPGDTVSSLSRRANVSVARIVQVNCIIDPNRIIAGTRLCLPPLPVPTLTFTPIIPTTQAPQPITPAPDPTTAIPPTTAAPPTTIAPTVGPDLIAVNIRLDEGSYWEDDDYYVAPVSVVVRNTGDMAASGFYVTVYASDPDGGSSNGWHQFFDGTLDAGRRVIMSDNVLIYGLFGGGSVTAYAEVDSCSQEGAPDTRYCRVREGNEQNNFSSRLVINIPPIETPVIGPPGME